MRMSECEFTKRVYESTIERGKGAGREGRRGKSKHGGKKGNKK